MPFGDTTSWNIRGGSSYAWCMATTHPSANNDEQKQGTMSAPLLEDEPEMRLAALEVARNNVLVYQFFQTLAWGMYFEVR